MTRLNLLRLNTMPAMDHALLADVSKLSDKSNRQLRGMGRLAYPMLRGKGEKGFARISWDQAYERIAKRIRSTTPDRLAFYLTSRGLTNETYYIAQKVARFLGTNNIDNAARLCHSPSTGAMKATLGVAASTCSYIDFFGTDLIVFFGANPANDQPVVMKYLDAAKKKGARIAIVNPYLEPGMKRYYVPSTIKSAIFGSTIADYHFAVSHGGDIAFLYGTLTALLAIQGEDREFIANHAEGFDAVRAHAEQLDWPTLESQSGSTRAAMEEFAALLAKSQTGILVWSMGITQHAFGGDTVQMILNLGLARGWVGKDNCGLMPIRGHSGVQGCAEMGAYATAFPGGKPINPENAAELSALYGFPIPPTPGLSTTEMVEAAASGELDLLYCLGGNFLRTLPDPDYVADAMKKIPLRVHQDIIVTDQMLLDPCEEVLLLPAKTRYEQDDGGTETTTERRVIFSPEIPRQVGEAKAEWKILLDIAGAAYPDRANMLNCQSGQSIRDEIARVIPQYDGIQSLTKSGDQFQYAGRHLCTAPDFKAHLRPVPLPERPLEKNLFRVSTRRGKQFNTLIYAATDPLTGAARDAILINPDDASALHLRQDDPIQLLNPHGTFTGRVHLAPILRGNLQIHWPEGNCLLARDKIDPVGKVPDYNAVVRIERC